MTRWIVTGLVAVNAVLAIGVYNRYAANNAPASLLERTAQAQIGAPKGDFAVVAGTSNNQGIIYIMESGSGKMLAIRTDPINHKAEMVTMRNVSDDLRKIP